MALKYCQGSNCHTYTTKDRLRGNKENKTFQTRRRSNFYYGNNNFCSLQCQTDWFNDFGTRAIDHFGRLTEPKHLTEQNAWTKDYDYRGYNNEPDRYYFVNKITEERRPLTEEQYRDTNYTLNER
tara:strand:+ start:1086 stop:1460 length:375 start_codon:yes stop_codon:yes gene_type:complete